MVIYILFKFISVFDPEMRDFFDEPRHPAGFHALIFNINVFNPAVIGGTSRLIISKLKCSAIRTRFFV
jgi:hypothetical protein